MMRVVNVWDAELGIDEDEPDGYRAPYMRIGPAIGAEQLAGNVVLLREGEALCPYHYELVEEELLIVLSGSVTVRMPHGDEQIPAGGLLAFLPGPAHAHQVRNVHADPARILILSERGATAATVYPDSNKLGIFHQHGDGRHLLPRGKAVDYWTDEPPLTS